MTNKTFAFAAGVLTLAGGLMLSAGSASALTMQECSAKYNAAKAGNALGGQSWNDFRKSQCSDDAPAAAAPKAQQAAPAARQTTAPAAKQQAMPASNAVFPRSIDRKYATETPAKQRMKTCLDQYNANKANGGNGDLKWIQKGGGYYSQCNTRMKALQG
ncbi:MAG: hypothetical protein LCH61_03020 [Proteobacteria bacterium]|nr:hypothetical protein [Pseudomonadota bacterium]